MKAIWTCVILLLAPLAAYGGEKTKASKPNILVIVADDLGYGDIGVHGGKAVPTPHIDKLAKSGMRCTSGYVSAPYCSPSRAGLLTGRYQTRFGHEFNPHVGTEEKLGLPLDQSTLANLLRSAGYATGIVGKWHLGFSKAHHPQSRGFDDFFGFLVGGHNYALRKDAEPKFTSIYSYNHIHRGREVQKIDGFATDVFTNEAIDFMKRNQEKPWFLYLAYNAVHTPLEISDRLKDRVPADVKDPARRGYLALLIGLDDAVGRLMAHLRESGAEENTLIIFLSDNGGSGVAPFLAYNTGINRPLRGNKGQTLEGGIRVPFFITWRGKLPAGETYDPPVISLDILPTACALAGVKPLQNVDGVNLMPHLLGENKAAPHEALYWRFGPQKAIRKGDWSLVDFRDFEKKTSSGWQLFDLSKDIGQENDLAAKHPDLVAKLSKDWQRWDAQNIAPLWHGGVTEDPTAPMPAPKKEPIQNSIGMKLVEIPAGEFFMGTDEAASDLQRAFGLKTELPIDDERPKHRVRITRAFYLGAYEVTVGEFRAFVMATGYRTDAEKDGMGGRGWTGNAFARKSEFTWDTWYPEQTDRHPVVNVSWNDAVAFCAWLSKKEGKKYRLPTEAEWEYACRAGTTTRFSSGDSAKTLEKVANFADPKGKPAGSILTTRVGSFQPNAFGLYDMHGNVWEFVADRYQKDYYAKAPVDDPPGPDAGVMRVMRGACWGFDPVRGRSSSRGRLDPTNRGYRDGFRVARDW